MQEAVLVPMSASFRFKTDHTWRDYSIMIRHSTDKCNTTNQNTGSRYKLSTALWEYLIIGDQIKWQPVIMWHYIVLQLTISRFKIRI